MSSIQRITGTNSGLDVDTLVKNSLKPYQNKIDKETQNKKVLEYQQEQYKKIMSDSSDFYDKYLDILKTGNLRSSSNYQTQTFESTDGTKVTAKGFAGSSIDNYTVTVTQLASKATDSLTSSETGNAKITIGSVDVKFVASSDGNVTVSNYNKAIADKKTELTNLIKAETDETVKTNLQTQLNDLNNNTVTAKYSEFSKNVVFTASSFGGKGFTLSRLDNGGSVTTAHSKAEDKYLEATIKNSSGQIYTISDTDKKTSNTVTVDGVQFSFNGIASSSKKVPSSGATDVNPISPISDLSGFDHISALDENSSTEKNTDKDGTTTSITKSGAVTTTKVVKKNGDTTITTEDSSKNITTIVDPSGRMSTTKTNADNSTVTILTSGTTTTKTMTKADGTIPITKVTDTSGSTTTNITTLTDGDKTTVIKEIDNAGTSNDSIVVTTEERQLDGSKTTTLEYNGVGPSATINKTTTTQIKVGTDGVTTKTITETNGDTIPEVQALAETGSEIPTDLGDGTKQIETTSGTIKTTRIKSASGSIIKTTTTDTSTGTKTVIDATTSTVTTTKGGKTTSTSAVSYGTPTSLTGSTNVTDLKDKIVKFVNDYNTLLTSINTKLFEKRDKDYMPLTDDQKKAMTEDQIKSWETKAQEGLLRRDDDLERIAGEMKSAMSTVMSGSGCYLEKIGITPVKDYSDKNGLFIIDEDKLTQALEDDAGNVKDLFTRVASSTDSNDKGGILTQLASTLKSEFKTSSSPLAKKAGLVGSSTEYDNTLTKSINDKTTLIKKLNTQLSEKETALYKKYSDLETVMGKLNSQQSSLASLLGQS